ncbi:MAG: molybdenum cofactor guanylyltransferase [Candidatus Thorarchaeota archaeon]|nr:molybdenum cofactor guanylyltransferase [Candidatus Thorarchaeota archaeon]
MSLDNVTVAILAGGGSSRFGSEKSLALFKGKPLISHMFSIAKGLASHVIIVASNDSQQTSLSEIVPDIDIVMDDDASEKCALNGAITAFEHSESDYTLLLPVDTPLASKELLETILNLREGHGAVVPAWPNGYTEPLHSVYSTEHAYNKGIEVMETGQKRMQNLLDSLTNVLYVQTEILRMFDEHLRTFDNANTPYELKRLEEEVFKPR